MNTRKIFNIINVWENAGYKPNEVPLDIYYGSLKKILTTLNSGKNAEQLKPS